ncbi:MAG: hypothetical protein H0X29_01170 [Parachlamydiaceae bacterium]|nr:hypothetical protein [Parachlamydiaceae bacterium]
MSGYTQDAESQQREARLYFDAGDFNNAIKQYQRMLEDSLKPWQRAVVTYNLGTTKLGCMQAEVERLLSNEKLQKTPTCGIEIEKWNELLQIFRSISLIDSPILLDYRLHLNMELTQLLMAKMKLEAVESHVNASLEDYNAILHMLHEAVGGIKEVKRSWCQLSKAEGVATCSPSIESNEIEAELKRQYAQVLQHIYNFMLRHPSAEQGSITLLTGIKAVLKHVNFLIEHQIDDHLSIGYLKLFQQQDYSWLPVWKSINELLTNDENKEKRIVFQKALKSFTLGLDYMGSRNYPDSQEAFKKSLRELNEFILLVFVNKAADEIVQKILIQYTFTLLNEPLQNLSLQSLIEMQALLKEPLEKLKNENLNLIFKKSQVSLTNAVELLQSSQPIQSRIYTEEAGHRMKLLAQNLNHSKKNPKIILKQMIENQEYALLIDRLRLSIEETESLAPHLNEVIHVAQSQTFQSSEDFYQSIILQQKEDSQSLKGNENLQIPWDEVLTSFEEGARLAKQSEKLLATPSSEERSRAILLQEKTLEVWKEALAKMQKKKKSDIKQKEEQQLSDEQSAEDNEQQPQPDQSKKEKSKQETGGSSINDVLQSLQEMENDDRSKPYFKPSANKGVERPW